MTTSTREKYQPTPLAKTETHQEGDKWRLVFIRHFKHSPDKVWRSLTDPAELREWAPYDVDRDLSRTGPFTLTMVGGDKPGVFSEIVEVADRPRLLIYTWGGDELRWQLEPTKEGMRLTLHHTVADRSWLSKVAAGWHICLDVAEHALDGQPIGRIVAEEAKRFSWERLNGEYLAKFGQA